MPAYGLSRGPVMYTIDSQVESIAIRAGGSELMYPPGEKTGVIVIESFPALGRLASLRFLEWVQRNPGGVVSLPTGKTPEFFIKWTRHFLVGWKTAETARELEAGGVDPSIVPDMRSLRFVQIDEFYPVEPAITTAFTITLTGITSRDSAWTHSAPCSSTARA